MDRVSFSVFASLSFVPAISHSVFFFAFAFIAGFFFHVKKARSKAIEFTDSNFNHVRERRTDLFSLLRILFLPLRNWRFFKRSLFFFSLLRYSYFQCVHRWRAQSFFFLAYNRLTTTIIGSAMIIVSSYSFTTRFSPILLILLLVSSYSSSSCSFPPFSNKTFVHQD